MNTSTLDDSLNKAVSALPELYQPLYGQAANLALRVPARSCEDRLAAIVDVISAYNGKSLKVLDIGCAQGYFSFGLADRIPGLSTLGVDYLQENISVCNLLAEKLSTNTSFICEPITADNFIKLMGTEFQVVLLLNVLHHICTQIGWQETQRILDFAANNSDFALIELSSSREKLDWVKNQPQDSDWLNSFNFVKPIGEFSTHISHEKRTLYFCSNKYFHAEGQLFGFSDYLDRSHPLAIGAKELGRHYYLSPSIVAKKFEFDGQHRKINYLELVREVRYLETIRAPKILAREIGKSSGFLVRENIPGTLLSETQQAFSLAEAKALYVKLLALLAELQSRSVYHHDLRPWNTLRTPNGSIELIDFGAITSKKKRHCFEDAVFMLSWLIKNKWNGNADPTTLLDTDCPWQLATIRYLQTTSTQELLFSRMLDIAEQETIIPPAPVVAEDTIQLHVDAFNSNIRKLALLSRVNDHLKKSTTSVGAYAKSLENELATIRSMIDVERNEAKKQIDALAQWATSADTYAKSLVEELETERNEAQKQIEALTQWATSADAYAKSLAEELEKHR